MINSSYASEWLHHRGYPKTQVEPLTGDVSPRRYFRVLLGGGATAILAGYAAGLGGTYRLFVETTQLMQVAGVPVPEILGLDDRHHWMLLEDLGEKTLYDGARSWQELEGHFLTAIGAIGKVQRIPSATVGDLNPHLDRAALWRELEQTFDTVLVPWGMVADRGLRRQFEETLHSICQQIGSSDLVSCHRDFMARNLVPHVWELEASSTKNEARLVVLDHQDLRLGPSQYDLASLLNDSLFPPESLEESLLAVALETDEELEAYRRAAVQRTLKAVGTFGAFARRGFHRHLPLIPLTLHRGLYQLQKLPEGQGLASDLRQSWKQVLAGTLLNCP